MAMTWTKAARWTAAVLGALVATAPAAARAQDAPAGFGEVGHVAVSAEQLFGFVRADVTTTVAGASQHEHINSLSVLGNSLGLLTLYAVPRVAGDVFVTKGLSVGASATYFHLSESVDSGPTSSPVFSGYVLAPRVGFAIAAAPSFSVWPRLGFAFAHYGTDASTTFGGMTTTSSSSTNVYAVTLEVPLVFMLAPRFFVDAVPVADIGVGGSTTTTTGGTSNPSTDTKHTNYGLVFGLGGYL